MELEQRFRWLGSRTCEILEDEAQLRVTVRSGDLRQEFMVPLATLAAKPSRLVQSKGPHWIGGLFLGALAIASLVEGFVCQDPHKRAMSFATAAVGLVPPVLLLLYAWGRQYDVLAFHNRYSGGVIFNLFYGQPNAAVFDQFISELVSQIGRATTVSPGEGANPDVAQEIEKFAALHEQGMLTNEEFAAVKKRLVETIASEPKRIGF